MNLETLVQAYRTAASFIPSFDVEGSYQRLLSLHRAYIQLYGVRNIISLLSEKVHMSAEEVDTSFMDLPECVSIA